MIALIDYGAGNLHSVQNALRSVGCDDICITGDKNILMQADAAILPGVGSFGHAMKCLEDSDLVDAVKNFIATDKPFLGICLGLQMLFEESEESPNVKGIGVLKGKITKIPKEFGHDHKVPHMGWNSLIIKTEGTLYKDIPKEPYVYFVHSYYLTAQNPEIVTAQTSYGGITFDVSVQHKNLMATQFHPEKSGDIGLSMLKNFVELANQKNID